MDKKIKMFRLLLMSLSLLSGTLRKIIEVHKLYLTSLASPKQMFCKQNLKKILREAATRGVL